MINNDADFYNIEIDVYDKYINDVGNINASSNFCYTKPIHIKKNNLIILYAHGYRSNVAMISKYDSELSKYIVLQRSIDNQYKYRYIVNEECDIVLSFDYRYPYYLKIINPEISGFNLLFNETSLPVTINKTIGNYIDANGIQHNHSSYWISDSFYCNAGDYITFSCNAEANSAVVAVLCLVNNTNYTVILTNIADGENYHTYEKLIEVSGNYVICGAGVNNNPELHFTIKNYKSYIDRLNILNDKINENEYFKDPQDILNEIGLDDHISYYITNSGNVSQVNNNTLSYSNPILLKKNEIIYVYGKGWKSAIAILSKCNQDGTGIVPLIIDTHTIETENFDEIMYLAENDMYVIVSFNVKVNHCVLKYPAKSLVSMQYQLQSLNEKIEPSASNILLNTPPNGGYCQILKDVGVIGDSLSNGNFNTSTTETNDRYYSWPQYMSRICNINVTNYTQGGLTTRSALNNFVSKSDFISTPHIAYIIALGVNDYYYKSIDNSNGVDLGSVDDIDFNDYNNCVDTYYGNYANIIMRIKEIQEKAIIFCITRPASVNETSGYNDAIRYMATVFTNVYIVDLASIGIDIYSKFTLNSSASWNKSHGTAIGYLTSANHIISYIDYIISNNLTKFKDIQFIGTDYSL